MYVSAERKTDRQIGLSFRSSPVASVIVKFWVSSMNTFPKHSSKVAPGGLSLCEVTFDKISALNDLFCLCGGQLSCL